MKNIKKLFGCIVMVLASINVFAQEDVFSGEWFAANKEGDLTATVTLNCDGNWQLNPFNEEARCNGFMQVNLQEPSGNKSVLVTYEFYVDQVNGNEAILDFIGGRPNADSGISGKCKVVFKKNTLTFTGTDKGGSEAVFNGLVFTKDGNGGDVTAIAGSAETDTEVPLGQKILAILQMVLGGSLFLFIIGHMGYVLFKGKRYKEVFTVEKMAALRAESGIPQKMTDDETDNAWKLMEDAFTCWTVVDRTDEDEFRKPTKMKQIRKSSRLLYQVIAMLPTDDDIIERLNSLTEVINSGEERHFDGSKKLIWLGVIVGVLMYWMMGVGMMISTLAATGLYMLASRTPQFLIDKRSLRGGGNLHNGIFAGVFAMLAGAQTVRTVYKFSNGEKAYSDDHSQHWIALAFALIILFLLAMMMVFWMLLNYLRNYVLFF